MAARSWSSGELALSLALAEALLDVVFHDLLELFRNVRPAQCSRLLPVDENRSSGLFARAGQRDADVGMLAFPGAVDDAAHDGKRHRLHTGILRAPFRHAVLDHVLHVARKLLEHSRRGAAAPGTGGHNR